MGSGASKDESAGKERSVPTNGAAGGAASPSGPSTEVKKQEAARAAQEARVKKARNIVGDKDKESDEFHNACMVVFQNADTNGDGMLDRNEFWNVLHSKSLNLNLSNDEKAEFLRMANVDAKDGRISYKEFVPLVKKLLGRVYEKKNVDWNDWCWFKSPQGKIFYMNKRTGQVQDTKPPNFREQRVEEQVFDSVKLSDGTEVTTCVDDNGNCLYMDWDAQEWKPMPTEWLQLEGEDENVDEHDPRVGEFRHPTRGVFATYLFENLRNTRLYFDDRQNQWARMPLSWERNVDEVKVLLEELDRTFPEWKDVNAQLLVLRECNYDLADAVVFAEINWHFQKKKKQKESMAFQRQKTTVQGRPPEEELKGNNMSVAASSYIHDLETKLAAATAEVKKLKAALSDNTQDQVKVLTREKTKVETSLAHLNRDAQESGQKVSGLMKQVAEQRETIASLEREVVAYKADRERMLSLEKQLAALQGDSVNDAVKVKSAEVEQLRVENVALKMKLQTTSQRLQYPMANPETAALIKSLHSRVSGLQKEKDALIDSSRQELDALADALGQVTKISRSLATSVNAQIDEITQKYRAEVLQRKLLYNKVQELRGNIRVFLRVRQDTRANAGVDNVFEYPSNTEVMVQTLQGDKQLVDFDRVYSPKSRQEDVFEDTKPIILSCVDGYNVCIMAYGQTGSGKTFTMMGPADNIGVNRRAIRELLDLVQRSTDVQYTIKVSLMEVYNEKIYDLLTAGRGEALDVHQNPSGDVYVGGLQEEDVKTVEDVESILARGNAHRSVASTAMNTDSSRSHLLMQLSVSGYNTISKIVTTGKLTLVDLAGSERVAKSEASGPRLVEAAAINKSLSALGHVFKALASNAPHIPYRNSKLTHVLQDSLGGDSKTCVFINCSPLASNLSETLCTINFGRNIRKIELGPASKHKGAGLPAPPKPKGK